MKATVWREVNMTQNAVITNRRRTPKMKESKDETREQHALKKVVT